MCLYTHAYTYHEGGREGREKKKHLKKKGQEIDQKGTEVRKLFQLLPGILNTNTRPTVDHVYFRPTTGV